MEGRRLIRRLVIQNGPAVAGFSLSVGPLSHSPSVFAEDVLFLARLAANGGVRVVQYNMEVETVETVVVFGGCPGAATST